MNAAAHPTEGQLLGFAKGDLTPREALAVMRHVLTSCAECQKVLDRSWRVTTGATQREPLDAESMAQRHRDHAAAVQLAVDRLLAMSPQQQTLRLKNTPLLNTPTTVSLLIDRAYALRFSDLHEMGRLLELAQLSLQGAVLAAESSRSLLSDLGARLSSHFGNLNSIRRDFTEARRYFEEADLQLSQGTGDPLELANSLKLRVTTEARSKAFGAALSLCDRATHLYRRCGDAHSEGETFVLRAFVELEKECMEDAATSLNRALELLDPEIDSATIMAVRHNRVILLQQLGQTAAAMEALREALPHYDEPGREVPRLQMICLEARLARDLGQTALAERSFLESLNGFVARDRAPLAAEVSLELATLYLEQNRYQEARKIARQTLPILRATGMQDEAFAAILVFREATMRDRLTLSLAQEALRVVREANESA